MNRELTQDECRDQRTLLKVLERNKLAEWLGGEQYWLTVVKQIEAMQQAGTTDGEDLAELTDEDARERPWVMCSHSGEHWYGPYVLLSAPPLTQSYLAGNATEKIPGYYAIARPLTQQEKERYQK